MGEGAATFKVMHVHCVLVHTKTHEL